MHSSSLAGAYMMRVVLLSVAIVLILTGVASHRATSAGGLFSILLGS